MASSAQDDTDMAPAPSPADSAARRSDTVRPLLLSGGPAVGKTTCGGRLAEERSRAAYVHSDDIRQLVVAGAATLWSGPAGQKQHVLAAHNIAAIASNLRSADYDVTIAEILTPDTLPVYQDELPGCLSIHLSITLDEAHRRAATRTVCLTAEEFDLLHQLTAIPPKVNLMIDVTDMPVDDQIDAIRAAWERASRPRL
jgi:hypothetical protein